MLSQNISNIIHYLNEIKIYYPQFETNINTQINLLKNYHIKDFLTNFDIFIHKLKKNITLIC
jgi:hypothetical protein